MSCPEFNPFSWQPAFPSILVGTGRTLYSQLHRILSGTNDLSGPNYRETSVSPGIHIGVARAPERGYVRA